MQWFIKEQIEEVATMSDLLRVVERSQDDAMDIEDYLAREQLGEAATTRRRRIPPAPGLSHDRAAHRPRRGRPGDARHPRRRGDRRQGRAGCSARPPAQGAELAVLPETFVSLYPSNAWAREAAAFGGHDELWERMWASSVDVPGPLVDELAAACAEHGVHCVIGVNERESERPGTLYNTMLLIGPEGLLHKHRKLMPTMHERLFHGIGSRRRPRRDAPRRSAASAG